MGQIEEPVIFKPEYSWEFLSADEIEAKSVRAVRNHVKHIKATSPWYNRVLADIDPEIITTPDEIKKLPFTDRTMVNANPASFLAVPREDIVESVLSSGSIHRPILFHMTAGDLDRLAFSQALSLWSMGVSNNDRLQVLMSFENLLLPAMGVYRGAILLGATATRAGIVPPAIQTLLFKQAAPTIIAGNPLYLRRLGQELIKAGVDTKSLGIEKIICTGEPIRTADLSANALQRSIASTFDVADIFASYTFTESAGDYSECSAQSGCHSHPELVYTEVIDSRGAPVPDGVIGELVITPLGIEGMPVLRYKTGDLTFRVSEPCSCGRKSCRIGPIMGRAAQILTVKGTSLYQLSLTNALDEMDGLDDYCVVVEAEGLRESVTIHAAMPASMVEPVMSHVRNKLGISIPVLVSNTPTINSIRGERGKLCRFVDRRVRVMI